MTGLEFQDTMTETEERVSTTAMCKALRGGCLMIEANGPIKRDILLKKPSEEPTITIAPSQSQNRPNSLSV